MSRKSKALEYLDQGYDIQITGRHVLVTDPMKDYAMDKIVKIERFTDRIIDANVIMDIQKLEHRVEIVLKVGHITIRSQASCDDMYISIDKAVTKIETQLRRYKKRLQNHHGKKLAVIDMSVNVVSRPTDEEWDEFEEGEDKNQLFTHKVISQDTIPLKMLTQEEAIMKVELSGDNFLLYKGEEDQRLKVIYRRRDGNYGIIEPSS